MRAYRGGGEQVSALTICYGISLNTRGVNLGGFVSSLFLEALDRDSLLCDPDSYPTPHSRQKKKGGVLLDVLLSVVLLCDVGVVLRKQNRGMGGPISTPSLENNRVGFSARKTTLKIFQRTNPRNK